MAEAQGSEMSEFSNTAFTTKLFDVLRKTPGNVFFSPYSLQVALAMTYSGATGTTAKELQKCLSFPENKESLYKTVQASSTMLRSSKDVTLNLANGMFLQQNYPIKPTFTKNLKSVFSGEAKTVNFANSAEAAKDINQYVSKNTNGKITDLFAQDAFNTMTKLVLVNAIYFKGAWMNKFHPENTFKGDFFLNKKDKVQVDYMKITKKFNATESDALKATIVELPYEGDLSMVLVVPKEIEGIKELENKLQKMDLKTLTDDAYSKEVELTMPKFKLEQKIELADPLKQIGIKEMFDATKATFGDITDHKELYVSDVVQKAYIEVNEEGSEAAAATAVKFFMRMMPVGVLELEVDRPFMFFIRHSGGTVLFAGRVSKL